MGFSMSNFNMLATKFIRMDKLLFFKREKAFFVRISLNGTSDYKLPWSFILLGIADMNQQYCRLKNNMCKTTTGCQKIVCPWEINKNANFLYM